MIAGAREGRPGLLRRIAGAALSRELRALVVPGPDLARGLGLDLTAAGLRLADSPRDASVLLIVGALPLPLRQAAAVAYAQMVRPRFILALGTGDCEPLPDPDVATGISQAELVAALARLRTLVARDSFATMAQDFAASVLCSTTQYVCPVHQEVATDQPGYCPKCGRPLSAREKDGTDTAGRGQPHADSERGDRPHHGNARRHDHGHAVRDAPEEHADSAKAAAPGHDGMSHERAGRDDEPQEDAADAAVHGGHGRHGHGGHDHDGGGGMSMVAVTRNLTRSRDGLAMDWIAVPFGPFFPGLPGGLRLVLTLDGDGVARGRAESLARLSLPPDGTDAGAFVERLGTAVPLASVTYRVLACRALEQVASRRADAQTALSRVAAMERERIASHLGWLAQVGRQIGFDWLSRRAASLQLRAREADAARLRGLRPDVQAVAQRLERTPLLRARMRGIGRLDAGAQLRGPVARAAGQREDARLEDAGYRELGFEPVERRGCDALDRLRVRVAEIQQSLDLISSVGWADAWAAPVLADLGAASGTGEATVETPRGRACLRATLRAGRVLHAELDTACSLHRALVPAMIEQMELGDALVAVGSLDLSPWEIL